MDIGELVALASQFIIVGAVLGCIAILIGYALFSILQMLEGGK